MHNTPVAPATITFLPHSSGLLKPIPQAPAAPEQTQQSMAAVRETLKQDDDNHDGLLSADEIKAHYSFSHVNILLRTVFTRLVDAQRTALPQLRPNPPTLINPIVFDETLLGNLFLQDPEFPGLDSESVNQAIREALPKGVAALRVSDFCKDDLVCAPIGNRMSVSLKGPAI